MLLSNDDRDRRDVDPSDLRLFDGGRTELELDEAPKDVTDSGPLFRQFLVGATAFETGAPAQEARRVASDASFFGEADLFVLESDSEGGRAFLVCEVVSFDLSPSADAG